jgi:hypothetical protein
VLYVGIDWSESRRTPAVERGWAPWTVRFPMCDPPYLSKQDMLDDARAAGLEPPRLYELGFSHNNFYWTTVGAGQQRILVAVILHGPTGIATGGRDDQTAWQTVQLGYELFDAAADVVADSCGRRPGIAGGVGELPVFVTLAGEDGVGVAAATVMMTSQSWEVWSSFLGCSAVMWMPTSVIWAQVKDVPPSPAGMRCRCDRESPTCTEILACAR